MLFNCYIPVVFISTTACSTCFSHIILVSSPNVDFTFSLLCAITCLLNALNGGFYSHAMCNFQQLYVVFGIGSNAWLNSIIAHQLHKILRQSNTRRRYKLPTRKQVTIQSLIVYAWCLFLGAWGYNRSERFPYMAGQLSGLACLPLEGNSKANVIFFWLCFFPLFAGIPIVYVLYICWDIYAKKLFPPPGQRRLFTIYFGRLIIVFLVMWIPTLVLLFVFSEWVPEWVDFFGGSWSHLQGGISAFLALLKPDIKDAFVRFLTCRCNFREDEDKIDSANRLSSTRLSNSSAGVRSSYWWPRDQPNTTSNTSSFASSYNSSYASSVGGSSTDLQDGLRPDSLAEIEEADIEEDTSYYFNEKSEEMFEGPKIVSEDSSEFQLKAEGSSRELCAEMGDHVISLKN